MSKFSAADTLELPVAERLKLVADIWDTIAAAPEALPLTDEDKRLIDERLEACRRNPQAGSPWEEVYARITSRRK
jgi:putative addiction module component (TIGR02574 family)